MALARFFYKHRRTILAVLLWCFAILSFLQWQQRKLKRKWKHQKILRDLDYGSGDNNLDSGLDILLQDQKVIEMEKPKPKHARSQGIECSIIEGVDWNINVSPRYRLRPDKFIVPVFTYGPNNQLHGFRESIFMAIKLNRTIIAPPFFKHSRNDITAAEEGDEVVDTFLRLDVKSLRKLVSTVPSSNAAELCSGTFDALYTTRGAYCSNTKLSRLMATCKYLNLDCTVYGKFIIQGSAHGKKYCPKPLIPIYPDWDTIPKTGSGQPFSFIDDLSKIQTMYKSDHVCPILGFPYRGISFHKTLEGPRHQGKITREDREIMKNIVAETPRPNHVRASVAEFITEKIRAPYVAMHWRYNDDDWAMHCENDHGNQKTCNKIIGRLSNCTSAIIKE